MYGDGHRSILREDDKDKDRSGDNDDDDMDGTDNASAGDCPPPQTPPLTIDMHGTRSCLVHDFFGIVGFKQCLIVLRLVDNEEDKEGLSAPQLWP